MWNQFLTASAATDFEPASIAQLIQVGLLPRRQSLAQIQGASLPKSRFSMLFMYSKLVRLVRKAGKNQENFFKSQT